MSLSGSSFSVIPTCYATVSIGTPTHSLDQKLDAIAGAGFQGIELGFPDLRNFASKFHGKEIGNEDFPSLCEAAKEVKRMVAQRSLKIVMLQPFANFEGWKPQSEERKDAFRRAKGWIQIMEAMGCDMLQVGSSDSPNIAASWETLAIDLRELADLLAGHDFRLAYKNWCWATHAPDWKDVWGIVNKVDRANIGLCLDTFQTAGGEWADPTTKSGRLESEASHGALQERFHRSLKQLEKSIPPEKIYILQISDAYKPKEQLDPNPDENGLRPRGRWSSCLRLAPFNGGYLPVVDVAKAILKAGFRGWFSMEIFDGGPEGRGRDWSDMPIFANNAMAAHRRLLEEAAES